MAKTLDEIIATLHKAADSNVGVIRNAFLAAVKEIRDNLFSIDAMEAALLGQSVDLAISASQVDKLDDLLFGIGMNNNAYVFSTAVQSSFIAGATAGISNLVASKQKAITFNPLNERATAIMRARGAQTIYDLTMTSRKGVQSVLLRGLNDGIPPTKLATEIRQLIGLTDPQAQAVINFRRQLEMQQVLGFTPPDQRRLNAIEQAMVRRHMKDGHFSTQNINDMVDRYAESMLNRRALDIARTESMSAVNAGQNELWMQGADLGVFDDTFRKFWITTPDDRLRVTHKAIPNMNPFGVKINAMFITPFGPVSSPGDMNSGLINCRCVTVLGEVGQSLLY